MTVSRNVTPPGHDPPLGKPLNAGNSGTHYRNSAVGTDSPQRARILLDFWEDGERVHCSEFGYAQLDGPWVHWLSDDNDGCWQSWPSHNVQCIDWEPES